MMKKKIFKNLDSFLTPSKVLEASEMSYTKGGNNIAMVFPWWDETEG